MQRRRSSHVSGTAIGSILVVITGAPVDYLGLALAMRFAERQYLDVTVYVTSDCDSFPAAIQTAIAACLQRSTSTASERNLTLEFLSCSSTACAEIAERCPSARDSGVSGYDLIVTGYSPSVEPIGASAEATVGSSVGAVAIRGGNSNHRSNRSRHSNRAHRSLPSHRQQPGKT
jgi:hypothetical protein